MHYKFNDSKDEKGKKQHFHELDGKALYGASSVTKILSISLHWWALQVGLKTLGYLPEKKRIDGKYVTISQEERLKLSKTLLKEIKGLDGIQWLGRLNDAYYAHTEARDTAAEKGVDTHKLCEDFVAGKKGDYTAIKAFTDWSSKNVAQYLFSEAHCYSEKLWCGGIADLGYISKDGKVGIVDFKSAEVVYSSHLYQIGLYDLMISENGWFDRNGNQLGKLEKPIDHYVVFPFGMTKCEAQYRFNIDEIKSGSLACLTLTKLDK